MPYTPKSRGNTTRTASSPISSTVWIGNISHNSTEYEVLKLAETIGKVVKFDFMYHDGQAGTLPRGYAFVTYTGKTRVGINITFREVTRYKYCLRSGGLTKIPP